MEFTLDAVHTMISPNPSAVQVPQHTNNCPPASRIFQGREKILTKMQDYFAQDMGKQHIYVLHGLGGAGKTQVALKFIQESSHFTNVFLVDASTVETIDTGFKNIAKLQHAGDSSEDAVKWLIGKHGSWLVFFDNADDPKLDLYKFLPPCNHGNIIITSRNPELRVYGSHSSVSGMEEEDAIALLLKSGAVEQITSSDKKTAAHIVKVLWHLPLAIVQAGAFIAKYGALNRYLDLYAKNHKKLLRERPSQSHSDYEWTVYTTWQMSFDQLSPAAAMLLQLCSFLYREGISEDIFSQAAVYDFLSIDPSKEELQQPLEFLSQFQGPDGEWDPLAFLELTTEIMSFSLATFAPEQRAFSIHPLVHQWSRDILADPELSYCIAYSIIGIPSVEFQKHTHSWQV
ncbi:P-loop containing nucleoside triphosphate hydrolase protein [Mycena metata]|uniref:P-loop containing nucleoside triphosphate hydrolase protein n=1 Tax=Mycena metata TaxID=1033252 RepID=A0AAD7HUT4_9AGAR|nr:P-loop containing nucleoside triphosphate hydrolase protein [Mycena metata]